MAKIQKNNNILQKSSKTLKKRCNSVSQEPSNRHNISSNTDKDFLSNPSGVKSFSVPGKPSSKNGHLNTKTNCGKTPLGNYANKVANTDNEIVTKPVRSKLYAIRTQNRKHNIVSDRTRNCGCKTIGNKHAEININPQFNSANISNIETCSSVWQCPVCRNKIMQGRANELKELQDKFESDNGHTAMITLTVPHYRGQSLKQVIGTHKSKTGLTGAIVRLRQHRKFRELKEKIGYIADCRALETTFGNKNGWHIHCHMIIYTDKPIDKKELKAQLLSLWSSCVVASGLQQPNSRGVEVTSSVNDYLAKWGAPSELNSDAVKQAKNGNLSIHNLEAEMLTNPENVKYYLKEYYSTMKGRKLLTWGGENIRKKYIEEKSDQELATDEHGEGERLFVIEAQTWRKIYYTGKIGEMLSSVEEDNFNGLFRFLKKYEIEPAGVHRQIKNMPVSKELKIKPNWERWN